MACEPLRCQAAGVHRRERVSHFHDTLESACAEGREGVRRGPEKPGQEHHADSKLHPPRSDGRLYDNRGCHRRQSLRGLRGAHFLAPTLTEGQVVVLDGLGAHRTDTVREFIERRGADLLFLPSYSPDLNPIEEAFSKIKNIVRKAAARTREALVEAISLAISALTLEDVAGWFAHCGYHPRDQYS
jgi:transposase